MSKTKIQNSELLVSEGIKRLIAEVCGEFGVEIDPGEVHLEHPADDSHGDYATNLALAKFKIFKSSNVQMFKEVKSPLELAEKISKKLSLIINHESSIINRVAVAPPGFINFWLKEEYLLQTAKKIGSEQEFKQQIKSVGQGKTMIIDYSSPNVAKPFGIGHLRSTNIGQAIYNIYSILGWKSIGDNHLGDWGTQFGKLIVAIKKWWDKELAQLTLKDLQGLYVKFHQEAEENPELEDKGREWFKKLEEGDQEAKEIWQLCVDISMKEFDRVYQILGVEIDEAYGEAFYHFEGWMDKVLADLKERKMIKESQGAKVVEIEGFDTPAMVIKSDGATTYLTRDLATLKFRKTKWDPDLVIYEVGGEQKFHFNQVFSLSERLGYIQRDKLYHVAHGLIGGEGGKFSTRKGDTIGLEEVLIEAINLAGDLVEKSGTSKDLSSQEKQEIAKAVGIGGVKFNDLKQEPQKDVLFDWDQILSMDGYSAPYLQYTYARCFSVISKADSYQLQATNYDLNEEEKALLRTFYRFPEVIISAAENFGPHLVCQYLFDLSQKFNLFYQKHRIIGPRQNAEGPKPEEVESFRLFLTETTASILKMGLDILGIDVLDKM